MAFFRKIRPMFRLDVLSRVILVLVFFISAVAKMRSTQEFEATLVKSELVSSAYAVMFAYGIIGVELVLIVGLLAPRLVRYAALGSTLLVSSYLSYSLWRWSQGINVPCSCFGTIYKFAPSQMAVVNLALLLLLIPVLRTTGASLPVSVVTSDERPVPDAAEA